MDNQRLILYVALFAVAFLLWEEWQQDYGPARTAPPVDQQAASPDSAGETSGEQARDLPAAIPAGESSAASTSDQQDIPQVENPPPPTSRRQGGASIRIVTDVLDLEISPAGGVVQQADLLNYPVDPKQPEPVRLFRSDGREHFVAQSGLVASEGAAAPNHYALYQSTNSEYRLEEGEEELVVPLTWRSDDGIEVEKRFRFTPGSYAVEITHLVRNGSDQSWSGYPYRQLQRTEPPPQSSMFIHTFTGGVTYTEEAKYKKIGFKDMRKPERRAEIANYQVGEGWVAMIQHYFVTAWVPGRDESSSVYVLEPLSRTGGDLFSIGIRGQTITLAPGESAELGSTLYVGPKDQEQLKATAPFLELSVDYGMFTMLAQPLFWLLKWFHGLFGNWGWAIIMVTLLIKLLFYYPSAASYRSMARMRDLQPRMQSLKERYGDNKERLNQALMDLYKTEKINPLGGCLPILIQIPVFLAFYWMLVESVELRQAPFMLWIQDLSAKDPYFVLPLIMGASMFVQQKLNPAPIDPIQQKVMMLMPVMFTVFFAFFPAGLVLYWTTNNVLSIGQQWLVSRKPQK